MPNYLSDPDARVILDYARKYGADPYTLLATAIVESGLNSRAVGDNGTSYGLFQMHVGGAGGSTHQSARRYLNPRVAAENRARHFKGGRGGAFAASVQRPADPSGYARKVDNMIALLRKQGLKVGPPAPLGGGARPQTGGSVATGDPRADARRQMALDLVFRDQPPLMKQAIARRAQTAATAAPGGPRAVLPRRRSGGRTGTAQGMPGKGLPPRRRGEADWQYIQRLGRQLFGLRNDPGNAQLTGGRHSAGSEHYDGRAVDFGDARNSREQLNRWKAWARRAGFDVLDEGDHIHVSMPGSGL